MEPIFVFSDYKTYLTQKILEMPNGGKGARSSLAQAAGCQAAYLSRVLNEDAHFSLDQAERVNPFLGHSKLEGHFFLLLVSRARAGTPSLRRYYDEQLRDVAEKRLVLKERLSLSDGLSLEARIIYYSAWYYSAIHVMLSIPGFRTSRAIAERLQLEPSIVSEALEFLVSVGLAVEEKDGLKIGASRIHLGHDARMIAQHHANWRNYAIRSLEMGSRSNLHYSSVVTLSNADFVRIREVLLESIERAKTMIRESKEERVCSFSLDFFEL